MKLSEYLKSYLDDGEICTIVYEGNIVGYYICLEKGYVMPDVIKPVYLHKEVINVEHLNVNVLKNASDGSRTGVNITVITIKDIAIAEHVHTRIYEHQTQQQERSFQMED